MWNKIQENQRGINYNLFMANNFKLFLELKRQDTKEHVRHKIDGQRFGHTNTVKLNVNTMYDVRVTVRPALRLQ